jgi:hypothetical protein
MHIGIKYCHNRNERWKKVFFDMLVNHLCRRKVTDSMIQRMPSYENYFSLKYKLFNFNWWYKHIKDLFMWIGINQIFFQHSWKVEETDEVK